MRNLQSRGQGEKIKSWMGQSIPNEPFQKLDAFALTIDTMVATAKLNDLSPMDYLTHVFRQLMEGNKDYESLLPGKLALQTI